VLGSLLFVMCILGMIVIVIYVTSTYIPTGWFKTLMKAVSAIILFWLLISFILAIAMLFALH
jgi:hypothetical protein